MSAAIASSSEDLYTSTVTERERADAVAARNNEVSQDQFLTMLLTQMTNQDPLNPMENAEFTSQMAQLQSLDEAIKTNDLLENLSGNSQVAEASGMIGSYVTGVDDRSKDSVEGVVTHVSVRDGISYLNLNDGGRMPLANVSQVDVLVQE